MAKFNFFKNFGKTEDLKPSEIQQQIDLKKESIQQLESDIENAGDSLETIAEDQAKDYKKRKKNVESTKVMIKKEVEEIETKKSGVQKKRAELSQKSNDAIKDAAKKNVVVLDASEDNKVVAKKKMSSKEKELQAEVKTFKQKEDKKFLKERNVLIEKKEKEKEALHLEGLTLLDNQKKEINKLKNAIAKLEKTQQIEITELQTDLNKQLAKDEISQDKLTQEISNLKLNHQHAMEAKRAEELNSINQWNAEFDSYAMSHTEFLDAKKRELELLKDREKNLINIFNQKRNKVEQEKKNFEREHGIKVHEMKGIEIEYQNKLNSVQQEFNSLSDLYKKEILGFEQIRAKEKQELETLVNKQTLDFIKLEDELALQSAELDNKFKSEIESISFFYQDLLAKEEEKLNNSIGYTNEEIRRAQEGHMIEKKELEEKRIQIENNFYHVLNNLKDKILTCKVKIKNSVNEHDHEIRSLMDAFEEEKKEITNSLKKNEEDIQEKRRGIEKEVEQQEALLFEYKEKLNSLVIAHKDETKTMKNNFENFKIDLVQSLKNKEENIELLVSNLEKHDLKLKDLNELRSQEKTKHAENVFAFTSQRDNILNEHQAKINKSKDRFQDKIEEFEKEVLEQKGLFEEKYEISLRELTKDKEDRLQELNKNKEAIIKEYTKENKELQAKINAVEIEYNSRINRETNLFNETVARLEETTKSAMNENQELKEKQAFELNTMTEAIRLKVDHHNKTQEEFRAVSEVRIDEISNEINKLKSNESELVSKIGEVQRLFDTKKNDLIKKTSDTLNRHLQDINKYELTIEQRRSDVRGAEISLNDLINHYLMAEKEETEKLEEFRMTMQAEVNEQELEIERTIAQLEVQKDNRIGFLRDEYEVSRKNIAQQLNYEILEIQRNIEEEKEAIIKQQKGLDAQYYDVLELNKGELSKLQANVREVENELENIEIEHQKDVEALTEDFEHKKRNLRFELQSVSENNAKQFSELKSMLDIRYKESEIERNQIRSAIDNRTRQLSDKQVMSDHFFEDYEHNEASRAADRERELHTYIDNLERLDSNLGELNEDFERVKTENDNLINEIVLQKVNIENEISHIIFMRNENYTAAIDQVKTEHDQLISDFVKNADEQSELLKSQNEEILHNFTLDFENYKELLQVEISKKHEEYARLINTEESKFTDEKERMDEYVKQIKTEDEMRMQEREIEKQNFKNFWETSLQEIRNRIALVNEKFVEDQKKIETEFDDQMSVLDSEKRVYKDEETKLIYSIHELEGKFNERKFQNEEKTRRYEEECIRKFAAIDNEIRQKEEKIQTVRERIDAEVSRYAENRKSEEEKLKAIIQSKKQLLAEEREKIDEVILKQQKIFDKLAMKKMSSIEEENRRNNKTLENEIRRIENEKKRAGEEFSMSIDELDKIIQEKEKEYEQKLQEQTVKNEKYIVEFKETIRRNRENENQEDYVELELATKIKDELLESERNTSAGLRDEISTSRNNYILGIYALQDDNNKLLERIEGLRKQYSSTHSNYHSGKDNLNMTELFNEFEEEMKKRQMHLNQLENDESNLHNEKIDKVERQAGMQDEIIRKHQLLLKDIEGDIASEQHRLIEFERSMSEERRNQKEMEIKNKNLFAKKLDYLRQKMFDN